jgi:hypothetical protein
MVGRGPTPTRRHWRRRAPQGEQFDEARDVAPVGRDHGDQAHTDGKGAKAPNRQQQDRSAGATFVGNNTLGGSGINEASLLPTLHLSFETHVASVVGDLGWDP